MKRKLSERRAWLYLADVIAKNRKDKLRHIKIQDSVYTSNGLCLAIVIMCFEHEVITERVRDSMHSRIPPVNAKNVNWPFVWRVGDLASREQFCRKQAKLLERPATRAKATS